MALSRDTRRWIDANSILRAILKYAVDNNGSFPSEIDSDESTVQIIGNFDDSTPDYCASGGPYSAPPWCGSLNVTPVDGECYISLQAELIDTYFAEIPYSPGLGNVNNTLYYINRTAGGRLLVGACYSETNQSIVVKR